MKKFLVFFTVVSAYLFLYSLSFAISQEEWNQGCYTKTKGTATVYSVTVNEETGEKETTPINSLPSGTYIHENVYDYDLRMWEISWYPGGSSAMGWVSRDNLTDATKWVYYSNGSGDPLPEALVDNPAALKAYMDRVMPGYSLQGDGSKPVNPYSTKPENRSVSGEMPGTEATGSGNKMQNKGTITATLRIAAPVSAEEQAFIAGCPQRLGDTVNASHTYEDYQNGESFESIPVGTYCMITDEHDDVARISYYKGGEQHSAYIPKASLMGAYTQYKENPDDDYSSTVYTGDPDYEKIIEGKEITWLAESIQNNLDEKMIVAQSSATATDSREEQESTVVEIRELGLATSIVYRNGKEETVKTGDLSFAQSTPEGKELAVVFAPKAGYASLRKKASMNGKVLKKIKAGTIVLVLEIGDEWTKIQHKNQTGFIKNSSLKYYRSGIKAKAIGIISYNGKTTVNTTVNVRNSSEKGSNVVAVWKVGKRVTVLNQVEGWVEVESDGICGYIQDKFISITD